MILGDYIQYMLALVFVLALIGLIAVVVKRFGFSGAMGGRRGARIEILETTAVDKRRRLMLIRRDNVEHLVMIGGGQDFVVESNIRHDPMERPELGPPMRAAEPQIIARDAPPPREPGPTRRPRQPEPRQQEPRQTEQRRPEPRRAEPRAAEPRQAEPREARPAEPRQAEPKFEDELAPEPRQTAERREDRRQAEPLQQEPVLEEPHELSKPAAEPAPEPRAREPQPQPRPREAREKRPVERKPARAQSESKPRPTAERKPQRTRVAAPRPESRAEETAAPEQPKRPAAGHDPHVVDPEFLEPAPRPQAAPPAPPQPTKPPEQALHQGAKRPARVKAKRPLAPNDGDQPRIQRSEPAMRQKPKRQAIQSGTVQSNESPPMLLDEPVTRPRLVATGSTDAS